MNLSREQSIRRLKINFLERNERDLPIKGRFITFEGGEGVGKTTQIALLAAYLRDMGLEVVTTREPGGTPKSERLRRVLLSGKLKFLGPLAETVVIVAARIDHFDHLIEPYLSRGAWVLCDRFSDSTRAYQGALGGVKHHFLNCFDIAALAKVKPDLTLVLDLAPEVGIARAAKRRPSGEAPDRFEAESRAFHSSLRKAFYDIAQQDPQRCHLIDASQPEDVVSRDICARVTAKLLPTVNEISHAGDGA